MSAGPINSRQAGTTLAEPSAWERIRMWDGPLDMKRTKSSKQGYKQNKWVRYKKYQRNTFIGSYFTGKYNNCEDNQLMSSQLPPRMAKMCCHGRKRLYKVYDAILFRGHNPAPPPYSQHTVSESLIISSDGNSTISTKTFAETADLFWALCRNADGRLRYSKLIELIFVQALTATKGMLTLNCPALSNTHWADRSL